MKFRLKTDEWIYLILIFGFALLFVGHKMTDKEGENRGMVRRVESFVEVDEVYVEETPISVVSSVQKTSEQFDAEEEALNKMGLTKIGGSKTDFSGLTQTTETSTLFD